MTGFSAYDSELRAIMNYPNVRGLFGLSPVKPKQMERQVRPSESFEFRAELEKWTQELREPSSNDNKPVEFSKGPKRVRVATPEFENESPIASPPKKQKTEVEGNDAMILEQDSYSIWDAMLWGSSCPGITESLLASSPQKAAQVLPEPAESVFDGEFTALQQSIPESWNFTIWEDEDAGTDDYSMVGRTDHPTPVFDDENKENEPPEFDVIMGESTDVSESQEYYYPEERPQQYRRIILGELQQN